MKLTSKKLHNLILEVYCEEANYKINQGLKVVETNDFIFEIESEQDKIKVYILNRSKNFLVGELHAVKYENPCFVIVWTYIDREYRNSGLGALIYDVATELVVEHDSYLACDRNMVSDEARSQWRYYASSSDYEQFQLDTESNLLTPSDSDNAQQGTFFDALELSPSEIDKLEKSGQMKPVFLKSPFTKGYRKKNITTLPCLKGRVERI